MTYPACKLLPLIDKTSTYQLRGPDGSALGRVEYPEICRLAYRGEVEAVANASRIAPKVRFLRITPPQEVLPEDAPALAAQERGGSITSQASKTTYREHVGDRWYIIQHKHIDVRFAGERAA